MRDSAFRPGRRFAAHLTIWVVASLFLTGCVFRDVREQQKEADAYCLIGGTVATERDSLNPVLVGLIRHTGGELDQPQNWALVDHFVLESAGRWMFRASSGTYGLIAYEDRNADGVYQPGEPFLPANEKRVLTCRSGDRMNDVALVIPALGRPRMEGDIDVRAFQARTKGEQVRASLGLATAYGVVTTLDDPRFREERATSSLWRPYDFIFDVGPGVYFLEPYDARKIPVLFVHGINGTPINFRALIERLDRQKYQPWVYYYPSGAGLANVADHLDQTMKQLQLKHGFMRYYVIAHSMGGLVSRGFLLRNQTGQSRALIPLYITISTPWGGTRPPRPE
jgi:hypothetical protein